jgi:hypothetical protein
MPKAIIEFDLPEENEEFDMSRKGADAYCNLTDIDNECRRIMKYEDIPDRWSRVLENIREMCRDRGVEL